MLASSRDTYMRFRELAENATDEINAWLRESNIGYEFVRNETIADSEMIVIADRVSHTEIVVPALHLLSDRRFATANAEFMRALGHLRRRENDDAIGEAAKSLETTLKILAAELKWPHDPNKDTLRRLLDIAIKNSKCDPMWQSHFESVRALLESGLGTARNRLDGHGQGVTSRVVPDYLARFAVHQAASAILFFVESNG